MSESRFRGVAIKTIAIIGFFATIVLIAWLIAEGIKRAPGAFASLASIAESISNYKPVHELTITPEKTVVNSNESFQILWTDVKMDGEYHFTYSCTSGVDLTVRDGDNNLVPVSCTDTLSLPATAHGLFITVTSDDMRLTDIPLKVSFTNKDGSEVLKGESKVTVVNAAIPIVEQPTINELVATSTPTVIETTLSTSTTIKKPVTEKVFTPVKVTHTAPKSVITWVYPQSNPNGVIDLKTTTIGSGIIKNGVFTYSAKYDRDLKNAIKFDIRNVGSKTSEVWTFKTIFPNGTTYESDPQIGLKPNEHVEFTLGFTIGEDTKDNFVKIVNTVYTEFDGNKTNNSAAWFVAVQN